MSDLDKRSGANLGRIVLPRWHVAQYCGLCAKAVTSGWSTSRMASIAKAAVKSEVTAAAKKVGGEKANEAMADPEPEPYITRCEKAI